MCLLGKCITFALAHLKNMKNNACSAGYLSLVSFYGGVGRFLRTGKMLEINQFF